MSKILGLDLGTNSIGWAIRDTNELENQIINTGVIHFQKGVGDGKSGEFSLAAERRKNRSKRRLYNAKRYRKWELLKVLIDNNMCPLTMDELRLWSIGQWKKINGKYKNVGRIYPINNIEFQQWLAFNPEIFGDKGLSKNGKIIRKNPYDLRCELINPKESDEQHKKLKIGRALYHLVQRRGFKSSRKSGQSTYAKNEEIEKLKIENPNFQISLLAKQKLENDKRFRGSGVIQRKYFEDEFNTICEKQKLVKELNQKLYKAIYFIRPLRSQKGLVGNCTLETDKPRIPISHPKFEEFRALQFINNIKWREKVEGLQYEPIPISLKKKILEELFFKKLTKGENKGKINNRDYFKFDEIIENYSENGKYEFNYKNLPNISTCPTIASLMNIFDKDWKGKFIKEENTCGINWDSLSINYKVKYGKKEGQDRSLKIDEIWHLLFDYIQTKDKQEELEKFCKEVLGFDDNKAKEFTGIDIPQGYGSLSHNAISKILPFLQSGFIYSEAVLFANLKKVLGNKFKENVKQAKEVIAETIKETNEIKEKLNIVNGLIHDYFTENAENEISRAKGLDKIIIEEAKKDTDKFLIKNYPQKSNWNAAVLEYYLKFLAGEQKEEEKVSNSKTEIAYYKLPCIDDEIKHKLKAHFEVSDKALRHLYHHSDIEIYPQSKTELKGTNIRLLESPQPPSKGWKNPMAMRTLHELRHLLNYLLKIKKIDTETKVVVEMARELNDANKRWAIQTYQRYREEENKEFAKAIFGVAKKKYPNLDENDIENINKVRLWWEQVNNNEEIYKQIKTLKEDVEKYRLWKEQECLCIYTGKTINLTQLFDGTQTQIMHTFPASISFDNSLANLTVGDAYYNNYIQSNKIPTQLPNYSEDITINGETYTAIEPRLKKWKEKVKHLRNLIDENKKRTKRTQDIETKKGLIQRRHLLQFDYDYWNKKLETFTLQEIPLKWKNSQLVDTQIISKYARAYLKTVFKKVDVQKGSITDTFKKIYQIKGNEQKDRSKHSHHAIDAAVLTLIPNSAKRDAILEKYYVALEKQQKFSDNPYDKYTSAHIHDIENKVIINHISHDKTLTPTFKNICKHGKKTGWIARGDSIRGQLHKETFFGAIKPNQLNENGYPAKDTSGKYLTQKDGVNDVIRYVKRDKIENVNIKDIVDIALKKHIEEQLAKGTPKTELKDFNDKIMRHVRFFTSVRNPMSIKKQTYFSQKKEKPYKQKYYAEVGDLYLMCKYTRENSKPLFQTYYLFDIGENEKIGLGKIPQTILDKKKNKFYLDCVLKSGKKVLLYKDDPQEAIENINDRLYVIIGFETPFNIKLKRHINAQPDKDLGKGENIKDWNNLPQKIRCSINTLNFLLEGKDFEINPDGTVEFKN
jgi:CRISPR-associated endonuclease Csn1